MKFRVVTTLLITILFFVLIGILASGLIFDYTPNALLARAYQGNRIIVNIHATVDGETVLIEKNNNLELTQEEQYENATGISKISYKENYSILKCRAGAYGPYNYYLMIDEKYPLQINMWQFNWWDIQRSDLYIDIDTESNTVTYYDKYNSLSENGTKIHSENEKTTISFDDSVSVWIGTL